MCRYLLSELLFVVAAGVLCGGDRYADIADLGQAHLDWYWMYLSFADGIPCDAALAGIMRTIDPQQIHDAFSTWMCSVLTSRGIDIAEKVIAIDGKQARRTRDGDTRPPHVVSAVISDWNLVPGQVRAARSPRFHDFWIC